MFNLRVWKHLALLVFFIPASSCYLTEERDKADPSALKNRPVRISTKVHIVDGSVILYHKGFNFSNDTISATGDRYPLGSDVSIKAVWRIPIDSVIGLEYHEYKAKGVRAPASLLLGATVSAVSGAAVGLALKAIFGSCPTVYTLNDTSRYLEAECFSYSIGRMFELSDLDRISHSASHRPPILRIKNEALETHYIDQFSLLYVDHPHETELFPDDDGAILSTSHCRAPGSAISADGQDVLRMVTAVDTLSYTTNALQVRQMLLSNTMDWIDCSVAVPRGAPSVKLVMQMKNSLQNTVLLYDVMMRNQGLNALEWSEAVNTNPWYSWRLGEWYKEFSGVQVLVREGDEYENAARIGDTGPIAWRSVAAQLSLDEVPETLHVRLRFLPDNLMIDRVAFDFSGPEALVPSVASLKSVRDREGNEQGSVLRLLLDDDGEYCVTYPGEWLDLEFAAPPPAGKQRTYFIHSNGYYVEWVRPEWVREREGVPGFDFRSREQTRLLLTDLWMAKKDTFEERFFSFKVPVHDEEGLR